MRGDAMSRIAALFVAVLAVFTLNAAPGAHGQEPAPVDPNGPPVIGTAGNPWTYLMQDWLNDNGFRAGPVDGWFGKGTRNAVVRFQAAVGLEQTGAWTWETSQAQQAYQPPSPPPSPPTAYGVWDRLARCESDGNWGINTGNGFYGGLQHTHQTWIAFGGGQYAFNAHLATREQQITIAERVLAGQGWGAWPTCSRVIGVR